MPGFRPFGRFYRHLQQRSHEWISVQRLVGVDLIYRGPTYERDCPGDCGVLETSAASVLNDLAAQRDRQRHGDPGHEKLRTPAAPCDAGP